MKSTKPGSYSESYMQYFQYLITVWQCNRIEEYFKIQIIVELFF